MAAPLAAAGVMAGGQLAQQLFAQKAAREQERIQSEILRRNRVQEALNTGNVNLQNALAQSLANFQSAALR